MIQAFDSTLGFPGEGPVVCALSWNADGLSDMKKRKKIFRAFKFSKYNVLLLQEHNLKPKEAKDAEKLADKMEITAKFSTSTREGRGGGTAILIKNSLSEDITFKHIHDGHVTGALFSAFGQKWHFVSIYGPQDKTKRKNLFASKELKDMITTHSFVGGDINTLPNPGVDHWSTVTSTYSNMAGSTEFENLMTSKGLRDELRYTLGATAKVFTRVTATVKTRLDRWYMPTRLKGLQYTMEVDPTWTSDHFGVAAEISVLDKSKRGPGRHRIDPKLMLEPEVRKSVLKLIKRVYTTRPVNVWGHANVFGLFKEELFKVLKGYSKDKKRAMRRDIHLAEEQLKNFEKQSRTLPPSQGIMDTKKLLVAELTEIREKYRPPNVWSAHMTVKRAEKASADFCRQFKAPFKPQFIEALIKTRKRRDNQPQRGAVGSHCILVPYIPKEEHES